MAIKEKRFFKLFINSWKDFMDNECMKFSASLSYYTIFALPSFAIFLISFFGFFLNEEEVAGKFFLQINKMIGNQAAEQVQEIVQNSQFSRSTILETVLGMITLLFSATGMFTEIQSSINDIWKLKSKPKKGLIHAVIDQFFSFSMIGIFGLILIISLLIDSFIEVFYSKLSSVFNVETIYLADLFDTLFVFFVITFIIFYVFKELPDGVIKFRDTLVGALFTSFFFMIGKWLIGMYIENSDKFTVYGTAGAILILLFWVYYSAIILYFGAVFTKNYALLYGTPIAPNAYSEFKDSVEIVNNKD